MSIAILKTDGTPVVIDSFSNEGYDNNGFLTSFKTEQVYIYYQVQDFKDEDKTLVSDGYYAETVFLSYRMDYEWQFTTKSITEVKNTLFNFSAMLAKAGDSVTVSVVNNGAPYENYYDENQYTFNIEQLSDGTVKKYKIPVFTDLELTDYSIPIPAGVTPVVNEVRILGEETNFYQKNFSNVVNDWHLLDADNQKFKKTTTLICFHIHHIVVDIFPLLLPQDQLTDVYLKADSTTGDLSDLSPLQQVMFLLMQSWGWFYQEGSTLVFRKDFPSSFTSTPTYIEYSSYSTGLAYFYTQCYRNTTLLKTRLQALIDGNATQYPATIFSGYTPLGYLIGLLPTTALAILPFSIIQILLSNVISSRRFTQNDQDAILKIVTAMSDVNIDPFLDYLLQMNDGTKTNFEIIYSNLNDAQLNNIPFVNIFLSEPTYKKYFCFALYKLWIKSKYNFNPPGITGVVNPNCYFLENPSLYNKNSVLTFSSPTTTDPKTGNVTVHGVVEVDSTLTQTQIKANVVTLIQNYQFVKGQWVTKPTLPTSTPYGPFHIFQAISLIGFQANHELNIPTKSTVPAFLFHFINEYDQLADFDADIALAVNITADILLGFFTGGESLADLVYFQYTGGLGQALVGTLPETQSILVWQGVTATSQTLSFTAGALSQMNDYLIATETDPARADILLHSRKMFLGLVLLTGGISALTQAQVINEAGIIINSTTDLSYLSEDVLNVLHTVYGESAVITTSFGNSLADYANINEIYQGYSQSLQLAFWNDYKTLAAEDLARLDGNAEEYMGNWLILHNAGLAEARVLDFICDANYTNLISTYINTDNLLSYIKSLTYQQKVAFLNIYNPDNVNLSQDVIDFMDSSAPDAMQLLFVAVDASTGVDSFLPSDVAKQLSAEFSNSFYKYLTERALLSLEASQEAFTTNIKNTVIELSDLKYIYKTKIIELVGASQVSEGSLGGSNQLFSTTNIFKNGQPVQENITEIFVSGDQDKMSEIFPLGIPRDYITDPLDYDNYDTFATKAWDPYAAPNGKFRTHDTEMKYIYNFLDKYYDLGDEFTITMESTLYTCGNCKRYLQALQNLAISDGKTITIEFISHPLASSIGAMKQVLKNAN